MTIGIAPTGYTQPTYPSPRFVAGTGTATVQAPAATGVDRVELTSAVPPEAQAQVDAAYQRALDLATENRELHFERDEKSGKIVVQVRDLDGNLIRAIPNQKMLEVLEGADL